MHGQLHALQQLKAAAAGAEGRRRRLRQRHPRLAQALPVRRPDRRARPGPDRARSADRPARPVRALPLRPRPGGAAARASPKASPSTRAATARAPTASCRRPAAASAAAHRRSSSTRCAAWCERGTREVVLLSQIVERYGRDLRPRVLLSELLQHAERPGAGPGAHSLPDQLPGRFRPRPGRRHRRPAQGVRGRQPAHPVGRRRRAAAHEARLRRRPLPPAHRPPARAHAGHRPVDGHHRRLPGRDRRPSSTTRCACSTSSASTSSTWRCTRRARAPSRRRRCSTTCRAKKSGAGCTRSRALQKRIATTINARYLGRTVDVLVEGVAKGRWYGRTRTNKLVHFASERPLGRRAGRRRDHVDGAVVPGGRARRRSRRRWSAQRRSGAAPLSLQRPERGA